MVTLTPVMSTQSRTPRGREVYDLAVRIGLAWREIRRGASTGPLREFLYGDADDSLEHGQADTLEMLARRESWRMSELAEALRVEPSTATRAVQRLERTGLAERRPSTEDGRVVEVQLTTKGREIIDQLGRRRVELFTHILRSYSLDELPQFAEMLERFVHSVDDFVAAHQPSTDA